MKPLLVPFFDGSVTAPVYHLTQPRAEALAVFFDSETLGAVHNYKLLQRKLFEATRFFTKLMKMLGGSRGRLGPIARLDERQAHLVARSVGWRQVPLANARR